MTEGFVMESSQVRLTIDSVTWQRVQLIIEGVLEGDAGPDSIQEMYFENALTGVRSPIHRWSMVDGRILIRYNVTQGLGTTALKSGTWTLRATAMTGEPLALAIAEGLSIPVQGYGGIFRSGSWCYSILPASNAVAAFSLEVAYVRTKGAGRRRIPFGSWIKSLRQNVYRSTFWVLSTLLPKNGRRILFTSDSRATLSGNLQFIHDRMIERGMGADYRMYTKFKPSIRARRGFMDKWLFTAYLAIADVVFMDDFQPMVYKVELDAQVKLVQLWHASGAFKTVGYSRVGKPGGPNPFSKDHRSYTHAIVSSAHDVPFYAEAFGIPEDRVIPTGIPRLDPFYDSVYAERVRAEAYSAFPSARDRKVWLFAPTFRGTGPKNAYYDVDKIDFDALHALCVREDAVVILKMHPFVRTALSVPEEYRDRILDATDMRELNDLLFIADVAITDYSSLVFEASLLGVPMLFYAYDLEEYISTRDFYEEFESFVPGKVVATFDDLLVALRDGDFEAEKVHEFAARHFGDARGGATDRVIDAVVLGR
ncbi:MAG: CDP-glycerol glycerophosphotransferase family protein [Coriobacteriia bacterium]|nr:CDP-glycerol glycerophosphotransferase family protein [Coriobacteriia bacterium]MBN2822844.1 CDP-glycerol glycerophosphotransferase family protein [Coriobacteriia bacterium]